MHALNRLEKDLATFGRAKKVHWSFRPDLDSGIRSRREAARKAKFYRQAEAALGMALLRVATKVEIHFGDQIVSTEPFKVWRDGGKVPVSSALD